MNTLFALLLILALVIALAEWHKRRQRVALLRWYGQRTKPIIEGSQYPGDPDVEARAAEHRRLLLESGNRWDVPVYVFAYRDVREADKAGHIGSLFEDFYTDYQVEKGRHIEFIMSQWSARQRKDDPAAFVRHILNQNTHN